MNSVSYVLSSVQKSGQPSIINHYLFVDPVYGTSIEYPTTATGSLFSETTGTFVYPFTADGGLFFPWGYPIVNTTLSADLGIFKGATTLTVIPSAIDNTYYATLKIVYDFDDNNEIINVEKGLVANILPNNVAFLDAGLPIDTPVSHIYYPESQNITTYYPTITVVNGNLALNVFNLKLTLVPDTVFEFDNFHLVNSSQLSISEESKIKSLEVFQVDEGSSSFISNFLLTSAYPTPTNTPTMTVTPSFTPTPSITPTLSMTPTVTPTFTRTPTITPSVTKTPTVTPTITPSS